MLCFFLGGGFLVGSWFCLEGGVLGVFGGRFCVGLGGELCKKI